MTFKNLPPGNYALSIAHPGHEYHLHGFMEIAKPFIFILTDGSERTGKDMMMDSIRCIDKAVKQGVKITVTNAQAFQRIFKLSFTEEGKEMYHLTDADIYNKVKNQPAELNVYVEFMVDKLIKHKIDYLVCDAAEDHHLTHDLVRMLCEIAVKRVKEKSGKEILLYDFPLYKPFDDKINEDCIRIELDEQQVTRKLNALLKYPLALTDLKPNINVDANVIATLRKMKDGDEQVKMLLKEMNLAFLQNEYIRPALPIEETDSYKKVLFPMKEILENTAATAATAATAPVNS